MVITRNQKVKIREIGHTFIEEIDCTIVDEFFAVHTDWRSKNEYQPGYCVTHVPTGCHVMGRPLEFFETEEQAFRYAHALCVSGLIWVFTRPGDFLFINNRDTAEAVRLAARLQAIMG